MARVNRGKCPVCFIGKVQSGHENLAEELWGDSPVMITNLPVKSCAQCGHRFISATDAKRLEKILDYIHENKPDASIAISLQFPIQPLVAGTASISLHPLTFEQTIRVLAHPKRTE